MICLDGEAGPYGWRGCEHYLAWGRAFAAREMPRWQDEAIAEMQEMPRLPGYWTGFRKLLGLQGAPNA